MCACIGNAMAAATFSMLARRSGDGNGMVRSVNSAFRRGCASKFCKGRLRKIGRLHTSSATCLGCAAASFNTSITLSTSLVKPRKLDRLRYSRRAVRFRVQNFDGHPSDAWLNHQRLATSRANSACSSGGSSRPKPRGVKRMARRTNSRELTNCAPNSSASSYSGLIRS